MRYLLLILTAALGCAQNALVPTSVVCPAGQQTIATQTGKVGTAYVLLSFSCQQIDASVTIDTTTTPPTVRAIAPPSTTQVQEIKAGPGIMIFGTITDMGVAADPSAVGFLAGLNNWSALQQFSKAQLLGSPTSPPCSGDINIGNLWLDTSDPATTHLRICARVASAAQWNTIF